MFKTTFVCYSSSTCFIVSFSWSLQLMLESLGCSSIICIDYLILHVITGIMFQNIFLQIVCYSSSTCFIVSFSWSLQLMLESLCLGSSFIFLFILCFNLFSLSSNSFFISYYFLFHLLLISHLWSFQIIFFSFSL